MIKNYLTSLKQEFSGYNTAKLMKDIMAGLTVCAVALPLALAFGVSSGATAAAGLVTAIIAGVVIAVLGGASFQISGPHRRDERRFGGHCGVLRLAGRVFRVLCGGRTAAFSRYF